MGHPVNVSVFPTKNADTADILCKNSIKNYASWILQIFFCRSSVNICSVPSKKYSGISDTSFESMNVLQLGPAMNFGHSLSRTVSD